MASFPRSTFDYFRLQTKISSNFPYYSARCCMESLLTRNRRFLEVVLSLILRVCARRDSRKHVRFMVLVNREVRCVKTNYARIYVDLIEAHAESASR